MPLKLIRNIWATENEQWLASPPTKQDHRRTFIILLWTALGLTIANYWGNTEFVTSVLFSWKFNNAANAYGRYMTQGPDAQLHSLCWWSGTLICIYFVVPSLITTFIFKMKLSDMGLRTKDAFKGWQLYVIMLFIMIPLVWYFSTTASFQARYPFYKLHEGEHIWPNFIIWEMMYFIQFASLEFFFRGFITLGTRKSFGYMSIFVMMVPYCMIHFGKPMPETIGAIVAGIVLGTLSMKNRSVILGIMIHYSVAITMDMMALYHR